MITSIENNGQGAVIYQHTGACQVKSSNLGVIKQWCIEHLFTYEGYAKAVKQTLGIAYRVPLYLREDLQLFPTRRIRDVDNVWINAAAIKTVTPTTHGACLVFHNGRRLELDMSLHKVRRQIDVLDTIRAVKGKHFH
ncbi:MAG: hypothetical protein EA375_04495 [Acholeplasmataceae bacterium]|nr:MAG: hypothetical protein EA375_04495 [Acholeplasmataceae bacterium]